MHTNNIFKESCSDTGTEYEVQYCTWHTGALSDLPGGEIFRSYFCSSSGYDTFFLETLEMQCFIAIQIWVAVFLA